MTPPFALTVTLTPAAASVVVNTAQTYTATVSGLAPGETIVACTWTFDTDANLTSAGTTRDYAFPKSGEKNVTVKAISSRTGRTATAEKSLIVTMPLR